VSPRERDQAQDVESTANARATGAAVDEAEARPSEEADPASDEGEGDDAATAFELVDESRSLSPEVLDADDDEDGEDEDDSDEGRALPVPAEKLPVVHAAGEQGTVSALTRYMAQLRHHAPISREQEHELAVKWVEEGDVDAARTLVLSNLRLVVKIAMDYRRAWANTLDLIQEGNVGLMEAVQRYDPYIGVKLSSYAVYWIRAYILKYILDNMRSVRMGTTRAQRKLFFRLNKEKRQLEREGFEAEPKLLAERLDVSEEDVRQMQATLSRPDLSMDMPAHRDEPGGTTYGDNVATPGSSAEDDVGAREIHRIFLEQVEAFAEGLSERDERILRARLLADEPLTLAELGEEFGVSRERVRQLEARLLRDMRAHMEANLIDFEFYAPSDD
jgi:RNA polymerase sigma-32 factor